MLSELDNDILPRLRDVATKVRPNKEKHERDFRRKQREYDEDTKYVPFENRKEEEKKGGDPWYDEETRTH